MHSKKVGKVDFIIDDMMSLSSIPIEVKSGKDYSVHSALDSFLSVADYNVKAAFVLSDERTTKVMANIVYAPIYSIMFFKHYVDLPDSMLRF